MENCLSGRIHTAVFSWSFLFLRLWRKNNHHYRQICTLLWIWCNKMETSPVGLSLRHDPSRGALLIPTPSATSLVFTSCITHPFLSHKSDQGTWMEGCVHFLCCSQNKTKVSPFLPDSINRLNICVKAVWLVLFYTNSAVLFSFRRSSLTCPHCLKQSNTFDPFLCISLPIPLCETRWARLFVLSWNDASAQLSSTHTHSDKWRSKVILYCHIQNAWKLFDSKSIWVFNLPITVDDDSSTISKDGFPIHIKMSVGFCYE